MSEIEKIYDENNIENIVMFNQLGREVAFEQIALIPYLDSDYVILRPVIPIEGVGEDEGLVFRISREPEELTLVDDLGLIDAIYQIYDRLVKEEEERNAQN